MNDPRTDQSRLRIQYADASNLNARFQLHQLFSVNPRVFPEWLFDQVRTRDNARVLEVGCGPGWLWRKNWGRVPPDWRITVTDFSPGMVREAKCRLSERGLRATHCVTDAQALPFDSDSFHLVFANHMLYHVPDLQRALAEFRRVLKRDGVLHTATNGRAHLREIDVLLDRVRPGTRWRTQAALGFALDDADADLARHFGQVEKLEYHDELRVTRPGPLLDFIASVMEVTPSLRHDLEAAIDKEIEQRGYYWIGKQAGLLIATGA